MQLVSVFKDKGRYEQQVHDALDDYRVMKDIRVGKVNGCEWYKITLEEVEAIVGATLNQLNTTINNNQTASSSPPPAPHSAEVTCLSG